MRVTDDDDLVDDMIQNIRTQNGQPTTESQLPPNMLGATTSDVTETEYKNTDHISTNPDDYQYETDKRIASTQAKYNPTSMAHVSNIISVFTTEVGSHSSDSQTQSGQSVQMHLKSILRKTSAIPDSENYDEYNIIPTKTPRKRTKKKIRFILFDEGQPIQDDEDEYDGESDEELSDPIQDDTPNDSEEVSLPHDSLADVITENTQFESSVQERVGSNPVPVNERNVLMFLKRKQKPYIDIEWNSSRRVGSPQTDKSSLVAGGIHDSESKSKLSFESMSIKGEVEANETAESKELSTQLITSSSDSKIIHSESLTVEVIHSNETKDLTLNQAVSNEAVGEVSSNDPKKSNLISTSRFLDLPGKSVCSSIMLCYCRRSFLTY
jgi:hypothetical protein